MATLAQFSRNIRKRGSQIENGGARLVRTVAKRCLKALVYATPVDKGVARSNWRVSIGGQTRAVIPAYAPGRHLGIGERANASATIAVGFATIEQLRPGRGNPLGSSLYIMNNTSYIGLLNSGNHSKQAPAGFVEAAVNEAYGVIPGFRLLVDSGGEEEE